MTSATAEQVREIGFPWFDRHAVRGEKEIFAFSRFYDGTPCPQYIRGARWESPARMLDFYRAANNADTFEERAAVDRNGFERAPDFTTWEEAEAWLFAPSGGAV